MKLSRRGKSARRGRHTKRAGKHLRYRGKKVHASKRYHRGHKRTHKRGRRFHMGRIKRGGKAIPNENKGYEGQITLQEGLNTPIEPVEPVITEQEQQEAQRLIIERANREFERLEELYREHSSQPLQDFLTPFDNIFNLHADNPARTSRLTLIMEYSKRITDDMVADNNHTRRDTNIKNILTEYLRRRRVDGVFL